MAEEKNKPKTEEKEVETPKVEVKKEEVVEKDKKMENETKKEDKKSETKEGKKVKKLEVKIEKKDKAIANGQSLRISTKSTVAVCKMISRKSPEKAVELLEGVVKGRVPVRMASLEVAHQKSRGLKNIAGAKFPKKVAVEMIALIKQLKANTVVNGIENPIIMIARADKAARPFRKGGRKAKRTHVYLEAREKVKSDKKKKSKKVKGDKK